MWFLVRCELRQSAPWGPRAYFGAVAAGRGLLVFGGIITQAAYPCLVFVCGGVEAVQNASQDSLARAYVDSSDVHMNLEAALFLATSVEVNDVWYTDLQNLAWQELPRARWEARAAFQAR